MINISQVEDRVIFHVNNVDIKIPYYSALNIAQNIRLASKQAMKMAREDVGKWREIEKISENIVPVATSNKRKRTITKFDWSVKVRDWDENVYLYFGNVEIIMHFSEALKVANKMRQHAKNAKAWAGDKGRVISAVGMVSDAELDYKLGI